jgi:hypothetical protein
MACVGLVVTDSAALTVGQWSIPAAKSRMSTRRQGDKRVDGRTTPFMSKSATHVDWLAFNAD